jgi:hypothetical protein
MDKLTLLVAAVAVPAGALATGLGLRAYLKRKHPGSWIRPTIDRVEDEELKRALKWTLNFGMMAGLVAGFFVGTVAQRRFLADTTGNTRDVIICLTLIPFAVFSILASRPPLGKWLRRSEAATSTPISPKER